jgi:hypothetical protein
MLLCGVLVQLKKIYIKDMYKFAANPSNLIYTAYYEATHMNELAVIPLVPLSGEYSGKAMTSLTNADYIPIANSLIFYASARIVPAPVAFFKKSMFKETFTVNTPQGNVVASALYPDTGFDSLTDNGTQQFIVQSGSGVFLNAYCVDIEYTSTGTGVNKRSKRKMLFYKRV